MEIIERALLPEGDYVSPGFSLIQADDYFPNMIVGDCNTNTWPYLRREIPHNWYVDKRAPVIGFVSRDEAHILYNTALKFKGKKALEIGCWLGWSACHLALAGVELDVIDPVLGQADFYESVSSSLTAAGVIDSVNLIAGYSPQKVEELATQYQRKWPLIFIDGNHEAPGPLNDASTCEKFAAEDALILFHDLASPDVAQGLDYLRQNGWQTMVYQTMQIMGVAWRGNVEPVKHQPDPKVNWVLPAHLQDYTVSGLSKDTNDEFIEILTSIRPYTILSEDRLFSLYSLAKKVCLEDIAGNFVECGTFKGGAAALLAVVIQRYSLRPRLLYAFDTFEGMPEPTEVDRHKGVPANATGFGAGTLKAPISENLDKICQLLQVRDIVVPVQGLFADTLPQYQAEIGSIVLLHADGDWYESTMDIFNTLYNSVVTNGIIQVDDYGHWEGCRKAVHDFEQLRGESFALHPIDYTGVWFKKQEVIKVQQVQKMMQQALALLNEAKPAEAVRMAEEAAALGTIVPGLHALRCTCLCAMGRQQEGLAAAKAELAVNPTNPEAQEQVKSLNNLISKPAGTKIHTLQRPWNTTLERQTLLSIQDAAHKYSYRSVPMIKNPFDFALYPLLFWNIKPRTIIEVGSNRGGSALWLADLLNAFSIDGHVYSIDIVKVTDVHHPLVTFMEGNGRNLQSTLTPDFMNNLPRPLLVIEDADHIYETTKHVLDFFHPYLKPEEYIIVEDGIISDLMQDPSYNSGPHIALKEFLSTHEGEYEVDANYCDFFGYNITWCTNGFLKKVTDSPPENQISPKINLIAFPDWSQPEESLSVELSEIIRLLVNSPKPSTFTLLVYKDIPDDNTNLFLSSITKNLLMQQNLDGTDGPEISLVSHVNNTQWHSLLPRIRFRISLQYENQQAIAQAGAANIPRAKIK